MAKINIRKLANDKPTTPEAKAYRDLGTDAPDYLTDYSARDIYIQKRLEDTPTLSGVDEDMLREAIGQEYDFLVNDFAAMHGVKLYDNIAVQEPDYQYE